MFFIVFENRNVGLVINIMLVKYYKVVNILNKFYVLLSKKYVRMLVKMGEENMIIVVFVKGMCWKV